MTAHRFAPFRHPSQAPGAIPPRGLHRAVFLLPLAALALLAAPAAAAPLNDTGIQFCGAYPDGNTDPPCTPDPEGQDMRYGADAAAQAGVLYKIGGGTAGRDYTKIAHDGTELDASAALGDGPQDWACTRDNVTGLLWEVKTASGLRNQDHTYTWYFNPSPDGTNGDGGNTATCSDTLGGENCNTSTFAAAVNAAQLCGFDDWRVPTVQELKNLVDHGRFNPSIDPTWFPNTLASDFWSASAYAGDASYAWLLFFNDGYAGLNERSNGNRVRLVRGGQ